MKWCLRAYIFSILALFPFSSALAGAWLQPSGQGQFITQASYYSSDKFYDRDGKLVSQPRFNKYEIQPYLEYGVTSKLTVGATGYAQHVSQSGITNIGLADPEIFARTMLWKNNNSLLSIQPLLKFKSYFAEDRTPRGGSGSTDAELSLLYGRNLHVLSDHDYLDMRAGYRYRANRLNDQLRGDVALGVETLPNLYVIPAIRSIVATKISNGGGFSENGDQDYDLLKFELGVNYRFNDKQAAGVTIFNHVDGTQTGNGTGVMLSYTQGFLDESIILYRPAIG